MSSISIRSDMKVSLVQSMGSDALFCAAARQSSGAEDDEKRNRGLINSLISKRHTSPFEHSGLTVAVQVPIFVSREWERHRTQSYSEMSLRYMTAEPVFWIPDPNHGIQNVGTRMKPKRGFFDIIEDGVHAGATKAQISLYTYAWEVYQDQIEMGVAEEVARAVLPLATYTRFWATANLVNWLRFLSLRTHEPSATITSYPQHEIEQAARQVESMIADLYELTYEAWNNSGRTL